MSYPKNMRWRHLTCLAVLSVCLIAAAQGEAPKDSAVSATVSPAKQRASSESSDFLNQIPKRIEAFRVNYVRENEVPPPEKFAKWDYADFLRTLLIELNEKVGKGEVLTDEQLQSLSGFADVQVIAKGYALPGSRGLSGHETVVATATINVYLDILRELVPNMGRTLSGFDDTEKDWDEPTAKSWLAAFDRAVSFDAAEDEVHVVLSKAPELRLVATSWRSERRGKKDHVRLTIAYDMLPGSEWDLWTSSQTPSSPANSLGSVIVKGAAKGTTTLEFDMEADPTEACFGVVYRRRHGSKDDHALEVIVSLPPGSRRPLPLRVTPTQ